MLMDKLTTLSRNSKILIIFSTAAIVAMLTYDWIVAPQKTYLHAAQQQQVMMSNAGKKTVVIKNRLHVKQTEIVKLQAEIAETKDSFFTPKIAREFFLDLEPISAQCDCDIESLTFMPDSSVNVKKDEEAKSSPVITKKAGIAILGRYENIIKFLQKLGGYSQRISISNLNIESLNFDDRVLICQMEITIYLIEDKEILADE